METAANRSYTLLKFWDYRFYFVKNSHGNAAGDVCNSVDSKPLLTESYRRWRDFFCFVFLLFCCRTHPRVWRGAVEQAFHAAKWGVVRCLDGLSLGAPGLYRIPHTPLLLIVITPLLCHQILIKEKKKRNIFLMTFVIKSILHRIAWHSTHQDLPAATLSNSLGHRFQIRTDVELILQLTVLVMWRDLFRNVWLCNVVYEICMWGFWCRSTHSPKCDLSLHCAAAAKRRDSTAFTISDIQWRRKRLLVCWLLISGTGSHQKKMLIVSCLTSYDWSYDVGLFFCLFLMMDCSHHVLSWLDVWGKKKTNGNIWYIWQSDMLYLQTRLLSFQTHYDWCATTGHGTSLCMQFTGLCLVCCVQIQWQIFSMLCDG